MRGRARGQPEPPAAVEIPAVLFIHHAMLLGMVESVVEDNPQAGALVGLEAQARSTRALHDDWLKAQGP